jgi:hypothetical protein
MVSFFYLKKYLIFLICLIVIPAAPSGLLLACPESFFVFSMVRRQIPDKPE